MIYQRRREGYTQDGRFPMPKCDDLGAQARPGLGRRLQRLVSVPRRIWYLMSSGAPCRLCMRPCTYSLGTLGL